ncbi:putative cullin [Helianthus annuus]|nr:putative cullin [Helianthus annuus]KAJ0728898.1 putative cullin [Helianthus annuus]
MFYKSSKAYNLVVHKFGEKLYSSIESTITSLLNEMAVLIEGSTGDLFLEELDRKCTEHNKALQVIRAIVLYMDNIFIPSTHKTPVHELVKIERGGRSFLAHTRHF